MRYARALCVLVALLLPFAAVPAATVRIQPVRGFERVVITKPVVFGVGVGCAGRHAAGNEAKSGFCGPIPASVVKAVEMRLEEIR